MSSKAINENVLALEKKMLADLQEDLEEELDKSEKECDLEKVDALADMIYKLRYGENADVSEKTADAKKELVDALVKENNKKSHVKLYKCLSIAAAFVLVMCGLNAASLTVFGQNMFSAIYELSKGGIKIHANEQSAIILTVSEDDPYGIKSKCGEYGFTPDAPTYIPEGFVLDKLDVVNSDKIANIKFVYFKENSKVMISYCYYKDNNDIPDIFLPTDTYNIIEKTENGNTIYILKEDNQFSAFFIKQGIKHHIYIEDVDYSECEKIVSSVK